MRRKSLAGVCRHPLHPPSVSTQVTQFVSNVVNLCTHVYTCTRENTLYTVKFVHFLVQDKTSIFLVSAPSPSLNPPMKSPNLCALWWSVYCNDLDSVLSPNLCPDSASVGARTTHGKFMLHPASVSTQVTWFDQFFSPNLCGVMCVQWDKEASYCFARHSFCWVWQSCRGIAIVFKRRPDYTTKTNWDG